jgi:hypothetical protein
MLSLQTKSRMRTKSSGEMVPGVELHSGLCGPNFHRSAAGRLLQPSCDPKLPWLTVDHVAVVVAFGVGQLFQPTSDAMILPKIQRGTSHIQDLTRRYQRLVNLQKSITIHLQEMIRDDAGSGPGQIPIGMVGHVHDGGLVGSGRKRASQVIGLAPKVLGRRLQRTRITLIAVGAGEMKSDSRSMVTHLQWLGLPNFFVKPHRSTMDVVGRLVGVQLIMPSIQSEPATCNSIAESPYRGSEEGMAAQVAVQRLKTKVHIVQPALAILHVHLGDDGTKIGDLQDRPRGAADRKQVHIRSIAGPSVGSFLNFHGLIPVTKLREIGSKPPGPADAILATSEADCENRNCR